MTCRSDDLPPITLTAKEYQTLRICIGRLLRLGIKDNRLTNITSQMSLALKKSARRAEKSATMKRNTQGGIVDRLVENKSN